MTSRYETKIQAFGLEPEACSCYGWEFFFVSFGAFLFSLEPLRRNSNQNFPEFRISGRILIIGDFRVSHVVLGFLDPRSNLFPTEDHEGVRIGSGGNPNDDERRRKSRELF